MYELTTVNSWSSNPSPIPIECAAYNDILNQLFKVQEKHDTPLVQALTPDQI
jgi:hypothetical protein